MAGPATAGAFGVSAGGIAPRRTVPRNRGARRREERPTLEQRIASIWRELTETGAADCPVCAGDLGIAACRDCGSTLT